MKNKTANVVTPVEEACEELKLDVDKIRSRCESVLSQEIYWFPVRHHSPAVAQRLDQSIRARKPKIIFLEGPAEANSLIPFVVDAKTKPPVAIYSSYRDDDNLLGLAGIASAAENIPPRFACWFPLMAYSPEYIAMMTAKQIGAEVVFMDLPHFALLKPYKKGAADQDDESDEADDAEADESNEPPDPEVATRAEVPKKVIEIESDRLLVESAFYEKLAEVAGYRSWNEAWDSLFEVSNHDPETFRVELATFCAAARATTHPTRILRDGTLERERFMKLTIEKTLAERGVKPADAMVVCGGFHLFLDQDDQTAPPEVPAGTTYSTVVPYSYFRVSELSGYAAGNRAPRFYQMQWENANSSRKSNLLIDYVLLVLQQARKLGEPLSSADAIAVCETAEMLAGLRRRGRPTLDDIQDALVTCCCKGKPEEEGSHLLKAMHTAAIGNALGRVTPALGQLPIVNDFYNQLSILDLGVATGKEKSVKLDLDKRVPLDDLRSTFFHRLVSIDIPLAKLLDAVSEVKTGKLFGEKWRLSWSPAVDAALIEKNSYGDSIESAALSRLRERLAENEGHAGATCKLLVDAINMDLPNMVEEVEDACGKAIDADARFVSQAQALNYLLVIERFAVYRNLRTVLLDELIIRCFDKACFSILDVVSAPEEHQNEIISGLTSLAEATLKTNRQALDRTLFVEHVKQAAALTTVPYLRGAFLGLLTELRDMSPEELANEVSAIAKGPPDNLVTAGDFFEGIVAVSRTTIMLGASALAKALDELLQVAEWEVFLTMVPKLRAAFMRMHDRQRHVFAERVAQLYGLADETELVELKTSVGAAARIAAIDLRVATIMKQWEF